MRLDVQTEEMETSSVNGSHYGFSAVKLEKLGATEYTLVSIAVDVSGSVHTYKTELVNCLKEIINACRKSPRADNLMIRLISFNSKINELHGFKLLADINSADYDNAIHPGGMTALYDASQNGIGATIAYSRTLSDNDYDVNGILFVITDGCDNESTLTCNSVRDAIESALTDESNGLESFVSVLIGVNTDNQSVNTSLCDFKDVANFTSYIKIDEANDKSLAKLAEFVSQSISSQSQSLGTGGPSQAIPASLSI